jgi:hypothetical protein
MRRKTFDVLFSTRDGMEMLVKEKCLWRSLWYFTMSVGLFCGVITNQLFLEQPLSVRFGIIAVVLVITGVCLLMYGFLLHGILCTMGALAGDAVGLICLLGYTTLPFLMLTPVALLSTKLSFTGIFVLATAILAGLLWMVYLLVRSLQSVYLIDFKRALATVLFSFLLIYTALVLPFQFLFKLLMLKFS